MADNTKIEWTDATWNPITGCSIVSPGCTNCYAMKLAGTRLKHHESRAGLTKESKGGPVWTGEVRFNEQWLTQPLEWSKPRMIFVCAHGDLFAEGVPDEWIDHVFAIMALAPQHTFQVLTKRPKRMREYLTRPRWRPVLDWGQDERPTYFIAEAAGKLAIRLPRNIKVPAHVRTFGQIAEFERDIRDELLWPLPNVWLGVSVEDQKRADERIPILLDTPAAIRWISAEPLLGPLNVAEYFQTIIYKPQSVGCSDSLLLSVIRSALDWVVAGGESGLGARPMHPDWARSIRDQCAAAGVPFLFKQWGAWTSILDREADDPDWRADYSRSLSDVHEDIRWINLQGGTGFRGERFHVMRRTPRSVAGRLLDGVEHNAFPVTGR
ncbi:hypothetical protein ACO34A_03470 [Rhizobium sp. ACO-34A]|nr:phage Gp37/Gp68 family protein [Rhizobium sp. ACO-34A]ATN32861.1 hypothetical protein ACO34A_03470 [Rhizobium sp. ACO-34A]